MAALHQTNYQELAPVVGQNRLPLIGAGLAVLLGVGGGVAVAIGNPLIPFAAIAGLAVLAFLLASAERLLIGSLLVALLLPFAVVPVKLLVTPAFLEALVLLLTIIWLMALIRGQGLNISPVHGPLLIFVGLTLFAFILGISRDFSTDIAHNYFRMFLGFVVFYIVTSMVDRPMLLRLASWFIVAGGLASVIGIGLWALGDRAERILLLLRVVGYPTDNVIRHLEANPALAVRATGTSVDPNSYAGMLVLVFSLALAQMLASRNAQLHLPRWLIWGTVATSGLALILTQSRSAWLGAAAAAGLMAFLRYRRLFVYGVVGLILVLGLGLGSSYLSRFQAGLALQDPATVMRLNEYANAVQIIQKYPWFGVGFGTAGEFERELTTGVSSVYLTIAERMGLIGVAGFAFVIFAFFAYTLPRLREQKHELARYTSSATPHARSAQLPDSAPTRQATTLSTILLGSTAAVAGALIVGILDHYFFNIEFPHMAMLFWLCAAIAVVAARLIDTDQATEISNKEQTN